MPNSITQAQLDALVGVLSHKGARYSTVVSNSHYGESLSSSSNGNSRVSGDESVSVQIMSMNAIINAAYYAGLSSHDAAYILAIAQHESGFNPDAAAGTTSASGLGQFIDSTGSAYGLDNTNRWDVDAQATALVAHYIYNKNIAATNGYDEAYIYALHHDGPSLSYGGLQISQQSVMPTITDFEHYVQAPLQQSDFIFPIDRVVKPDTPVDSCPIPPAMMALVPFFGLLGQSNSPLIIDMNGNGIEVSDVTTNPVYWDNYNTGFKEATAWVGANDALLVIDRNNNGVIDSHSELFGTSTIDGFTKLRDLDSNHDNVINASDAQFTDLKIWIDNNQDGISQESELQTLTEAGLQSINLNATQVSYSVNGNLINWTSSVTFTNNTTAIIADAWFKVDSENTLYSGNYTLDVRTLSLPAMRGYGEIKDISIAMSLSETLLNKVTTLANLSASDVLNTATSFDDHFKEMLFQWNDNTIKGYAINSGYSDSVKVEFMESLAGTHVIDDGLLNQNGGPIFNTSGIWDKALTHYEGNFLAQSAFAGLFTGSPHYNTNTDLFSGATGLSSTFLAALSSNLSSSNDPSYGWSMIVRTVETVIGVDNLSTSDYNALNNAIQITALGWTLEAIHDLVVGATHNVISAPDNLGDTVYGTFADDKIYGGTGNDILIGGLGDDILFGGDGDDVYHGGLGRNFMYERNGPQNAYGNDTFVYGGGHDTIFALIGSDKILFDSTVTLANLSMEHLNSSDYSSTITTYNQDLIIHVAGQGVITVVYQPTSSVQTIQFSDNSTLALNHLSDPVYGTSGNDNLFGVDRSYYLADHIIDYSGDNIFHGGLGHNLLEGGNGNDTYVYGGGLDNIHDGYGTDQVVFDNTYDPNKFSFSYSDMQNPYDNTTQSVNILYDGVVKVVLENVFQYDSNFIEHVVVSGVHDFDLSTLNWDQHGTSGNDSMYSISDSGFSNNTVYGMGGDDFMLGNAKNDHLDGGAGNDTLLGQDGNDIIVGGTGDDSLQGGYGNDIYKIALGDGNDTIYEHAPYGGGVDTVQFTSGVGSHDLWFSTSGNDLKIDVIGQSQTLTVASWLDGNGNSTIEHLTIGDVLSMDGSDIASVLSTMQGVSTSPPASLSALPTTDYNSVVAALDNHWHTV